ncbi:MAG: PRC-barrel domain-containing protein [Candidatus Promineifilaceae bacterium]|jgi:sporulation protein YlmC with PRC-barrel domain
MRSAKELVGKPIYSVTDGRHIGSVKDLYLDSDLRKITGVYVGSEGIFNRRARLIPRSQVVVFGADAVLVADSDVIVDDQEHLPSQGWLRREDVQGRVMYTAGGTKVASVGDIKIDEDSRVVIFTLARVFVEGPLANNRLVERSAILDAGGFDGTMVVDLAEVEQTSLGSAGAVEVVDYEENPPFPEDEKNQDRSSEEEELE